MSGIEIFGIIVLFATVIGVFIILCSPFNKEITNEF